MRFTTQQLQVYKEDPVTRDLSFQYECWWISKCSETSRPVNRYICIVVTDILKALCSSETSVLFTSRNDVTSRKAWIFIDSTVRTTIPYFAAHGQIQHSYVSYHIKFIFFFTHTHTHKKKDLGVWPLKGWAEETNKEAGKQGIFLLWDLWAFFFLSSPAGDKNRYLTELPSLPVCSPTRRKE